MNENGLFNRVMFPLLGLMFILVLLPAIFDSSVEFVNGNPVVLGDRSSKHSDDSDPLSDQAPTSTSKPSTPEVYLGEPYIRKGAVEMVKVVDDSTITMDKQQTELATAISGGAALIANFFNSAKDMVGLGTEVEESDFELTEDFVKRIHKLSRQKIKVIMGSASHMIFARGLVGAVTALEISLGESRDYLVFKTESGSKKLKILPDEAVMKVLEDGYIDQIDKEAVDLNEVKGEAPTVESLIMMQDTEKDNLTYVIQGMKSRHFFGFIPVTIKKTLTISGDDGELIKEELTIADKIKDLFST